VATVQVLVTRTKDAEQFPLPAYQRAGDAGLDLRAAETVELQPGQRHPVKTGLHVALPEGFVGLVRDRSGLASRNGLHILAGVIDSNYRGEIQAVIINLGDKPYAIKPGDRIAQLIILPCVKAELRETDKLPETERNSAGFGSTGVK